MCSTPSRKPPQGKVVHRGGEEYEARRQGVVWNSRVPDRFPDSISMPTSPAEVAELVQEANRAGQRIAVRSGGHNWLGASLRDGGLLVDLGELTQVEVDPSRARARVGAGATHKMLADAIVEHGLAFPIGHCSSVGLGGYLLAGGMGWNLRGWGAGCWNVSGAEVVNADGAVIRVDQANEPDLLWALRGGGSGFPGLVTSFHLDLFPLPVIATRHIAFDLSALPHLLRAIAEALKASEPGLEVSLIVRPTRHDLEQEARVIVALTSFAETQSATRARIEECPLWMKPTARPLEDSGPKAVELNDLEGEGGWSDEFRYAVDTCWVEDRYEQLGELIIEHMLAVPSSDSRVVLAFGYLPDRDIDVAFTGLGDLTTNVYATWRDSKDDHENIDWLRDFMVALSSLSSGTYIGESDPTIHALADAYPEAKLARLKRIIKQHDPRGVFHSFLEGPEVKWGPASRWLRSWESL